MDKGDRRKQLQDLAAKNGVNKTAKDVGISRIALLAFLADTPHTKGTDAVVEAYLRAVTPTEP